MNETAKRIQHALVDLDKSKGELFRAIKEDMPIHQTQLSSALHGTNNRGDNERAKILEAAEKVIRRWEEDAAKKKKTP